MDCKRKINMNLTDLQSFSHSCRSLRSRCSAEERLLCAWGRTARALQGGEDGVPLGPERLSRLRAQHRRPEVPSGGKSLPCPSAGDKKEKNLSAPNLHRNTCPYIAGRHGTLPSLGEKNVAKVDP